jgi:ABC-type nitrate/sulfonate/bicarbonate transport system permease component
MASTATRRLVRQPVRPSVGGRPRAILTFAAFALVVLIVWEGAKLLGGTPWRALGAAPGSPVLWVPPFQWDFANDLNLPHIWTIVYAFGQPFQRGAPSTLFEHLVTAALYTWREAAIGFLLGTALGLGLATLFVHSRLLERAFVPYVVASQTIPIIALAPMIVFAIGQGVLSVVIIATYLTFFPVTIAMIRGLRSFDPRALELMRSYAASPRRCRTCSRPSRSARPRASSGRSSARTRAASRLASGGSSRRSTPTTSPAPRSSGRRSWWPRSSG